jgi:hypothetical protein
MTQKSKTRNKRSVADLQQIDPEQLPLILTNLLTDYIKKTDIPILSEFCAELDIYEEALLMFCSDSKELRMMIKILENKKRAALERKIYTQELNATIGANLLKTWRENESVIPEQQPKVRHLTPSELIDLGTTEEEYIIYSDLVRRYDDARSR